jgi:hypothetical protein
MEPTIPILFRTQYIDKIHLAIGAPGKLVSTFTEADRLEGNTLVFPNFSKVEALIEDYYTAAPIDEKDGYKLGDDRSSSRTSSSMSAAALAALGQQMDDVGLQAILNQADLANRLVGTSAPAKFTKALFFKMVRMQQESEIPEGDKDSYFVYAPKVLEGLSVDLTLTDYDKEAIYKARDGESGTLWGVNLIPIGLVRKQGKIPTYDAGANYLSFMYHKSAVGFGLDNDGIQPIIDWIPDGHYWQIGAQASGGATVIDDQRIVAARSGVSV